MPSLWISKSQFVVTEGYLEITSFSELERRIDDKLSSVEKRLSDIEKNIWNVSSVCEDNNLELNTRVEVMIYPTVRKIIQENKNVEIVPELLINMLADIYEELSKIDKFINVEAETCAVTFGEYLNKKEG